MHKQYWGTKIAGLVKLIDDAVLYEDPSSKEIDAMWNLSFEAKTNVVILNDKVKLKQLPEDTIVIYKERQSNALEITDELLLDRASKRFNLSFTEEQRQKLLEAAVYEDIISILEKIAILGEFHIDPPYIESESNPIYFVRGNLGRLSNWKARAYDKQWGKFNESKYYFLKYFLLNIEASFKKSGNANLLSYAKGVMDLYLLKV